MEPEDHAAILPRGPVGDVAKPALVVAFGIGTQDHTERQYPHADRNRPRSAVPEEGAGGCDLRVGLADGRSLCFTGEAEQAPNDAGLWWQRPDHTQASDRRGDRQAWAECNRQTISAGLSHAAARPRW